MGLFWHGDALKLFHLINCQHWPHRRDDADRRAAKNGRRKQKRLPEMTFNGLADKLALVKVNQFKD